MEIQPGDDVVTHKPGVGWRGVIIMSTRATVRTVQVDSTRDEVRVTYWSHSTVDTFRPGDDVEVERHT